MTTRCVDIRVVSTPVLENYPTLAIWRPYQMHSTGQLVPARIDLRWEKVNDDGWQLIRASVSGQRLKKDGEPGKGDATTYYVYDGRQLQDEKASPQWLFDAIHKYHPELVRR